MAMSVYTVVRWVLSSCSFGYQCFGGNLHFDQKVEYLTETTIIHLQDFTPENLRTRYINLLLSVTGIVFIMDLESKITVRLI